MANERQRQHASRKILVFVAGIVISVLLMIMPAAATAAGSWSAQSSGTSNLLENVSFIDHNTGWAVGDNGTILATRNGGATWSPQTSNSTSPLNDVSFADASHGWAVGDGGTILATSNGGATWIPQTSETGVMFYGVSFADASNGWAVGDAGTILHTVIGGAVWNPQASGTGNSLEDVNFIDQNHGWAVGDAGTILATSNGGTTWAIQTSGTVNDLNGVSFIDQNHGWAVGGGGTILVTSDGGQTWTPQTSGTSDNLLCVSFTDSSHGWATGNDIGGDFILVTSDGGATWNTQKSGIQHNLYGISFADVGHGWAVGDSGTILSYTAPPPTVSSVAPSGWINSASPTVSADYADNSGGGINTASVSVSVDGTALSGCTVSAASVSCPTSGLADGSHTITGSVADNAGNSSPISGSFSVDTQVPSLDWPNSPVAGSTINYNNPTLSDSYGDSESGINISSVTVSLDGTALSGCNATDTIVTCATSGLANGAHNWTVNLADNAGNPRNANFNFTVDATDTTAPVVSNVAPAGTINSTSTTVSADYSDSESGGTGINTASVTVKLDGNPLTCTPTATSVSCPTSGLAEGSHTISGSVADNAGNSSPISGSFSVDTVAPTVNYTGPGAAGGSTTDTNQTSFNITGTESDPAPSSGVNSSTGAVALTSPNNGTWTQSSCTITGGNISCPVSGLTNGEIFDIKLKVTDGAGNSTTTGLAQLLVDTVAPVSHNDAPSGWQAAAFTVNLSCSDSLSGCDQTYFILDGGATQHGNSYGGAKVTMAIITDGDHTIEYWSTDKAGNSESAHQTVHALLDTTAPATGNLQPGDGAATNNTGPTISADYSDSGSGINTASVVVKLDGGTLSGCTVGATSVSCPTSGLADGSHTISGSVADNAGNSSAISGSFSIDTTVPTVSNVAPAGTINTTSTTVSADYSDSGSGINSSTATLSVSGGTVGGCTKTATSISCPVTGLTKGSHTITGSVSDNAGNSSPISGSFSVITSINYYWPWYDDIGGSDWVILGNNNASSASFDMYIGSSHMDLGGASSVDAGQVKSAMFPGQMNGPARLTSTNGVSGILSQRTLWPKGGSSLEEVPATAESNLSGDFYWPWYDQQSPGYQDWVVIANPDGENSGGVYYQITIAGKDPGPGSSGTIPEGGTVSPSFPGVMNGPVELKACKVPLSGGACPSGQDAKVAASQRVLSNAGGAFNELPGISASSLTSDYVWPWYDMTGGAKDWVLISNPGSSDVTYQITIAGKDPGFPGSSGTIPAGGTVTPVFPGTMNGPVEVKASGNVIASQRSIWGHSFEEVPGGYQSSSDAWAWYDQNEGPGVTDWMLIANADQSTTAAGVTVTVNGKKVYGPVDLPPNTVISPTFPKVIGGPVQVTTTSGKVVASQRVLWNGYFNEVLGQPPVT